MHTCKHWLKQRPKTRREESTRRKPMPVLHKTQPEPTPVVGGAAAGTSKKDAPLSTFKNMGHLEKANPFAKIEDMMSRKRTKIHKHAPQTEKMDMQQGPQEPLSKEPVQKEQPE